MAISFYNSPVGWLKIVGTKSQVDRIDYVPKKGKEERATDLTEVVRELQEYFAGRRKIFDYSINRINGTEFQQKVWREMEKIPYGKTITYGELAAKVGNPKAARAIGGACNKNPIPIIVPCHRVVGANKSLTGYAGGIDTKKFLLNLEQND
jgi:methylated-DNA-[protein]-cysteine S-methyltransferase